MTQLKNLYVCLLLLLFFFLKNNQPIQTDQLNQALGGQGTPSPLSPTPSPAGSVGSVGSQSSGYSSGELAVRGGGCAPVAGSTATAQAPTLCMLVPMNVYHAMTKQNQHFTYLFSCQDLWEQADNLVLKSDHKSEFGMSLLILFCDCTLIVL